MHIGISVHIFNVYRTIGVVDQDMVWKFGKLQNAYNELRFDVGLVLTVHKSFVFRSSIFKQHG